MYSTKNGREKIPRLPTFLEEQTTQHFRLCVIKNENKKIHFKGSENNLIIGNYHILYFDEGTKTDNSTFPSTSSFIYCN